MWFKNTTPITIQDGFFILATPNHFTKDWLESRHLNLIKAALYEATGADFSVKITVRGGPSRGAKSSDTKALDALSPRQWRGSGSDFNLKYTFEAFVIGSGNQFAHAACLAVADNPSSAYNPLFLYGEAGLGKTHLLHAIGNYVKRLYPQSKTRYVTSEKFTNDFINSIRDDKIGEFQKRYRGIDVLLMDDIHFIINKERTQEEFFHTFNTLYEAHKQIVLSSDRPPKEMPTLEERLRSRFACGLIADIQPPDLETRVAILRKKAEMGKLNIPDDVMLFIATKIQSNIRHLEGALTRLAAFSSLTKSDVNVSLAEDVLKEIIPETKPKEITIKTIQAEVARYYDLSAAQLVGPNRSRFVVFPRQVAMYLARQLTGQSLPKIGELFGGRDHTTVMHAHSKIADTAKADREAYDQIQELINRIKQKSY
jgi:chromosomal replication initiator protein